jgi:hypothetical protein
VTGPRGTTVYKCNTNSELAYDIIHRSVLFYKNINKLKIIKTKYKKK